jgi:hypothetical protein
VAGNSGWIQLIASSAPDYVSAASVAGYRTGPLRATATNTSGIAIASDW